MLVTGDCGTSDHEALTVGRARGLDVIVIDHHELPTGESPAYALVNSRRADDTFAFKGLASCGVAFYLAAALRTRLGAAFDPRELLDLVALGTIADLVPLTDENRILVAAGLKVLSARKRPGLAALAELAELVAGPITAHQAAFRLTPRLNAAGRLGEAQLALDLLLASPADAPRLADAINDQNTERQRIQELVWMEARAQGAAQADAAAVVVGAEGWHQGVVGIVAARLVDELGRPAIAIGFKDGEGRGSGPDGARRQPVRGARRLRDPPDQIRRPRRGGRDEPDDRSARAVPGRLRRRGRSPAGRTGGHRGRRRRRGRARRSRPAACRRAGPPGAVRRRQP